MLKSRADDSDPLMHSTRKNIWLNGDRQRAAPHTVDGEELGQPYPLAELQFGYSYSFGMKEYLHRAALRAAGLFRVLLARGNCNPIRPVAYLTLYDMFARFLLRIWEYTLPYIYDMS